MIKILDKIVLLVLGGILIFQIPEYVKPVVVFLVALTMAELGIYVSSRKQISAIFMCYIVLCLIEPLFIWFLPLLFYDAYLYAVNWGYLAFLLGIQLLGVYEPWMIVLWITTSVLSVVMANHTKNVLTLRQDLIHLRDTSTELNMIMNNKNKELMEKQDYEIHVATLRERNRIAREIHDNVGHMLSRSILQVGALTTIHREEPLHGQLDSVNETLNLAMNNIRESVHDLHDDSIDLKQAILEATKEMQDKYDLTMEYDMSETVPRKIKYCFITTVKEAMSNIVKHSNAEKIEIILREHPGIYQLSIEDDGDVRHSSNAEPGIGLSNMKERVDALGGTISINNEHGFKIFISIRKTGDRQNEDSNCG